MAARHYVVAGGPGRRLAATFTPRRSSSIPPTKRNTDPPSADQGLEGWNLEATLGSFLATPIDATHFIAAKHVVQFAVPTLTFNGGDCGANLSSDVQVPNSDLVVYTLSSGSFSTWATLYNSAVDGSDVAEY